MKEHGSMMGFSNAYDMIKQFSGKDYTTEKIHTWREMVPDANYELCVLAWDKNGVFQEITKVPVTTKKLGGPGEATVDIKIGEFGGSKKGGYYQDVVYSPNDQASLHRDIIITEEAFNKPDMGNIGVIKMLQTDHPKDIYWNQYRVDRARWNATPLTTYYACSIAKNLEGGLPADGAHERLATRPIPPRPARAPLRPLPRPPGGIGIGRDSGGVGGGGLFRRGGNHWWRNSENLS